jgi:O-methyltransferase
MISAEQVRFSILRRVARVIFPRYRFQWPQMAWWDDRAFNDYLVRFGELEGMNAARRWTLYQLVRLTASVPGDTAECGVFEGAGSYLICKASQSHRDHTRTHFMFDSFEGLSTPSAADGTAWTKGNLACALDRAQANLGDFVNLSWHRGWIPEAFVAAEDRTFSFVHVDVDLQQPTRDSIRFFYPRVNNGGIIVCDDYGFTSCPGATQAIDEFLSDKPEQMISLASGGGFLMKGRETAKSS